MMELDHKCFKYASVDTVLDTIPDKLCKIFVEKPADDTEDTIQQRQSQNTLPTGHNVLTRLVHEVNHKALNDASQKVVVELFSQLSDAYDNLSKVAKSISKLGQITTPEQFSFVLKLAMRPLIQLKIPPPPTYVQLGTCVLPKKDLHKKNVSRKCVSTKSSPNLSITNLVLSPLNMQPIA